MSNGTASVRRRQIRTRKIVGRSRPWRRSAFAGVVAFAVVLAALPAGAAVGNWPEFRSDPINSGTNPAETTITTANVASLTQRWTATTGAGIFSSPAVVGGVLYVGSTDAKFYAFDAAGVTNCSGTPATCAPLWTATTGGAVYSSPAVAGGIVYVGSDDGKLYAFDAAGVTNCSGTPKTCAPLWTATTSGGFSSPTVVGGVVYVGGSDGKLYAFDAAGVTNCSGTPKTCAPLWESVATGREIYSSPAVVGGVVYIGANDGNLYAFDAAGVTNCSGTPRICAPLWTGPTGEGIGTSSPAVVGGVVYVGARDDKLYAFDAAGVTNCSGTPRICAPLWTASTAGIVESSPAVAGGVVYVGSALNRFYAFDAAGVTNCSGTPKTCAPLWTATTGESVYSSPAVAGGVVYVGASDRNLYAFDAAGAVNCSGTPKTCTPLWSATTGGFVDSSPAVADGMVYVGSEDGKLYAFGLPFTASPTISTQASAGGPLGTSSVTDTATVSGGASPTGTVTFRLFSNDTCTSQVFTSTNNLSGGTATSGAFTPAAPGTYYWTAAYNGDANNNTATSACNEANESVTIWAATTTLVTQASAGGPVGTQVTDTATLSGGTNPTGTIEFWLWAPSDTTCGGPFLFTDTVAVSGNGTYTSDPFTPTGPGTYRWSAQYLSDVNNGGSSSPCNSANESVTITKAQPTISTQASAGGPPGTSVTDTATISAGASPTGTVTFRLFSDNLCTGQVFTSTNDLSGGTATSGAFTPAAPGTFYWTAVYNGDANNNTATSGCNAPNETTTVNRASPALATQASAGGAVGVLISDTATLTGGVTTPTGSVSFRLYGPNDANCGGAVIFAPVVPVAGNGTYNSGNFTTTAPGTYRWIADYSGDANNNAVSGTCNAPNESVTIAKASPSLSTQASAGGPVGATSVTDTATVSGGFGPTGPVTFRLFSDTGCATEVFTSTNTLSGATATSGPFTPTVPGTYFWTAVYAGDANNNGAVSSCGAPNESVTITRAQPTLTTQASSGAPVTATALTASISDTATLSSGVSPTGTLTFRLYGPDNVDCAGTPVFAGTKMVAGNGAYTSNPFPTDVLGSYRWLVDYAGDAKNLPATSPCNAPNEVSEVASVCAAPPPPGTLPGNTIVITASGVVTVGTPGNDVIYGTAGADQITGGGGDDVIFGMGGNDNILGADGRDTVCGGDGNDRLAGGPGDDLLSGDAGDDDLAGGDGNDRLVGGPGVNRLAD
jgi:outer membrane protein assembly factor BamB